MEKKQEKVNRGVPVVCGVLIVVAVAAVVTAAVMSMMPTDENDVVDTKGRPVLSVEEGEADYGALTAISSQELLELLAEKKTGFVYIGRPTCPVCSVFAPILTKVVKEDKLQVYYYNTDTANSDKALKTEALNAVDVVSVPTFMYVKDGVEVERLGNAKDESTLREFIQKYL